MELWCLGGCGWRGVREGKGAVSCSLTTLKTQLALVVTAIGNSAYRSPGWENTTCAYSTQSLFRDYRERAFPLAFDSSCPPTYTCAGIGLTQSPQCHSQAAPISYRHVPKLLGFCFVSSFFRIGDSILEIYHTATSSSASGSMVFILFVCL